MKKKMNFKKRLRSGVAAALLLAFAFTGAAPYARALDDYELDPYQATKDEFPTITVEGNVVQDAAENVSDYFELSLVVQTPADKKFSSVAATLDYDPAVLRPVTWTTTDHASMTTDVADYYGAQLDTKKDDRVSSAVAWSSEAQEEEWAHLYFYAESQKPVELTEPTRVATIRFYVCSEEKFTVENGTDGTVTKICYGGKEADLTTFVNFTPDDTIVSTKSPANSALRYGAEDERHRYYYVPSYAADPDHSIETVQGKKITNSNGTFQFDLDAPETKGQKLLAINSSMSVDDVTNAATYKQYYSYLSNLIPADHVKFTLVSDTGVTEARVKMENAATINFYDWDDTLIGTLIVPKEEDVRKDVNEYVKVNMIHPKLQDDTNYSSMERQYTYRGEYPTTNHGLKEDGSPVLDGTEVKDGAEYPLTNKLDYVFFKRVMEQDPDTGGWTQKSGEDGEPVFAEDGYPYAYGWALCPDGAENLWTTLGSTGELDDYQVDSDTGLASFTYDSDTAAFAFADFEAGVSDSVVSVKAVYEPGKLIKGWPSYALAERYPYSEITTPKYGKYSYASSSAGGVYSVNFAYGRVYTDGCGVLRARKPVINFIYTPDTYMVDITKDDFFSSNLEIKIDNTDIIEVTLTPSSGIVTIGYHLVETYNANFLTGTARSSQENYSNKLKIPDNFLYDEVNNVYADRFGTNGIVLRGTMAQLFKEATLKNENKDNRFTDYAGIIGIVDDLNLRRDLTGTKFSNISISAFRTRFLSAVAAACAEGYVDENGYADLTWHQLQYYIATCDSATNAGGELLTEAAAAEQSFGWCKVDDCAGGSDPIYSLSDLLAAVLDYLKGNDKALNLLNNDFTFRKNVEADPFADVEDFKAAFIDMIKRLLDASVTDSAITAMTWKQAQYLLCNSAVATIPNESTITDNYWWKDGGKYPIADLATLLTVAYNIVENGYNSSWLDALTLKQIEDFKLRADAKGAVYTNLDAFKTAVCDAMTKLVDGGGYTLDTINTNKSTANKLELETQHTLLGKNFAGADTLTNAGYWWITGAPTPTGWADVLSLAWQVYVDGVSDGLLEKLTAEMVRYDNFYLRADADGALFAGRDALLTALKSAVTALQAAGMTDAESVTWTQFQSALLGETIDVSGPYWWENGGHKPIDTPADLLAAAWNTYAPDADGDGYPDGSLDPQALDALTEDDATLKKITGVEKTETNYVADDFYLRKNDAGDGYESVSDVKTALKTAVTTMKASGSLTWIQLQYLLINNVVKTDYYLTNTLKPDYWWKDGGSRPTVDYTQADARTAELTHQMSEWRLAGVAEADAKANMAALLSEDLITALNFQDGAGTVLSKEALADQIYKADLKVSTLTTRQKKKFTDSTVKFTELTWKELQNYIINAEMTDNDSITTTFAWYPANDVPALTSTAMAISFQNGVVDTGAGSMDGDISDVTAEVAALIDKAADPQFVAEYREQLEELRDKLAELDGVLTPAEAETSPNEEDQTPAEDNPSDAESDPSDAESGPSDAESDPSGAESNPSDTESNPSDAESGQSDTESDQSDTESDPSDTESDPSGTEDDPVLEEDQEPDDSGGAGEETNVDADLPQDQTTPADGEQTTPVDNEEADQMTATANAAAGTVGGAASRTLCLSWLWDGAGPTLSEKVEGVTVA